VIEALLLIMAIGFVILLLYSATRRDTENPDELLGLFAYKLDKSDQALSRRRETKRNA